MTARIHQKPNLGEGPVGRLLIKLALPAVVAQVINLLYNLIDRMYVSAIPVEGTAALAGLGIAFPVLIIVGAFALLVGMGGAPLAAIRLGEQKKEDAERILNNGVVALVLFSAVLTTVLLLFSEPLLNLFGATDESLAPADSYLKIYAIGTLFVLLTLGLNPFISAQGFALTSMLSVAIGAALNIALDPLFIFTFHMGVRGAALATVLSQAASAVWVVLFLFSKRSGIRLKPKMFRFNLKILLPIFALGISPFIMQATESAIQIVFFSQLNAYTAGDTEVAAAMSVMLSAMQFVSLPINGLASGAQPLISYNYGAGKFDRIKTAIKWLFLISLGFAGTAWLVCLFAPGVFSVIFHATENVAALIKAYLPVFMLGTIFFAAQFSFQNSFLALGQSGVSLVLALLRKVILLIPLAYLLPLALGFPGVYWAEAVADAAAALATTLVFLLSFRKIIQKRKAALTAQSLIKEEAV